MVTATLSYDIFFLYRVIVDSVVVQKYLVCRQLFGSDVCCRSYSRYRCCLLLVGVKSKVVGSGYVGCGEIGH